MFEKSYKSMNEQIKPDDTLIDNTIKMAVEERKPYRKKAGKLILKPSFIAAAVVMCLLASVPVMAANIPAVYEAVSSVMPEFAQRFVPIRKSCEDNGIKMEVVATYVHDNTAEIYITMQDLTGDRIDETTDLYDSYSINRAFDSICTCSFLGFDPETRTATFLINITELGDNHTIEGEKLTFSVKHFISGKRSYDDLPIDLDLNAVSDDGKTIKLSSYGIGGYRLKGGGGDYNRYFSGSGAGRVPQPGDVVCTPVSGIDISATGYVDGMLHIQTAVTDLLKNDNHGYLYLVDSDGNHIQSTYTVSFFKGKKDDRIDYTEFVFDIGPDEIEQYSLYGSFVITGNYTEGRWQVTFPLITEE